MAIFNSYVKLPKGNGNVIFSIATFFPKPGRYPVVDIAVEATAPDPANRTLSEGFRERQGTENIFSKLVDWVSRGTFAHSIRLHQENPVVWPPNAPARAAPRTTASRISSPWSWDRTCDLSMYPLVNVYSLRTGKWSSRNSGFTQLENGWKWWIFPVRYVNVYQRVIPMISLVHHYIPILPPSEGNKSIQKSSFFLQPNVSLPEDNYHDTTNSIPLFSARKDRKQISADELYPLVMTNSSPWYRWPIEIDGLPIKNGDFPWPC